VLLYLGLIVITLLVLYLVVNHSRNSNNTNQSCASDLVQLVMDHYPTEDEVLACLRQHDTTYSQALHIVSMTAPLSKNLGVQREVYMRYARYLAQVVKTNKGEFQR